MTENTELTKYVKNETIELSIIHLTKYVAAYRKSYNFCGRVDFAIKITGGLAGSSVLLELVPAIPIFVAFARAVPVVLTVVGKVFKEVKFVARKSII